MAERNTSLNDRRALKWHRRVANTAFTLAISVTALMIVVPFTGAGIFS